MSWVTQQTYKFTSSKLCHLPKAQRQVSVLLSRDLSHEMVVI